MASAKESSSSLPLRMTALLDRLCDYSHHHGIISFCRLRTYQVRSCKTLNGKMWFKSEASLALSRFCCFLALWQLVRLSTRKSRRVVSVSRLFHSSNHDTNVCMSIIFRHKKKVSQEELFLFHACFTQAIMILTYACPLSSDIKRR
jgi:hypothetical protein